MFNYPKYPKYFILLLNKLLLTMTTVDSKINILINIRYMFFNIDVLKRILKFKVKS